MNRWNLFEICSICDFWIINSRIMFFNFSTFDRFSNVICFQIDCFTIQIINKTIDCVFGMHLCFFHHNKTFVQSLNSNANISKKSIVIKKCAFALTIIEKFKLQWKNFNLFINFEKFAFFFYKIDLLFFVIEFKIIKSRDFFLETKNRRAKIFEGFINRIFFSSK